MYKLSDVSVFIMLVKLDFINIDEKIYLNGFNVIQ